MANQVFAQSNETNCLNVFSSCIPGADLVQTWLMESPVAIFDESSGSKMMSEDGMVMSEDGSVCPLFTMAAACTMIAACFACIQNTIHHCFQDSMRECLAASNALRAACIYGSAHCFRGMHCFQDSNHAFKTMLSQKSVFRWHQQKL